jgi:hypothetical protein
MLDAHSWQAKYQIDSVFCSFSYSENMDFNPATPFRYKPHIAVLSDICNEPGDAEFMTRFLLYANGFNIDALISTSSI